MPVDPLHDSSITANPASGSTAAGSTVSWPIHLSRKMFEQLVAPTDGEDAPKWVQIAAEGDYPGYREGTQPFSLTRQTFEEIVANFRTNPSYRQGPNGIGAADVVAWDFHHASELYPGDGDIPIVGAPAQGWTVELEVRDSEDGKAELWGLTHFMELARSYIKRGQYQWASVAVSFNTIDPATAKNVGAVLTSVALTNQPIVKGMQQLVASRQGARHVMAGSYRGVWIEPADKPEDAMDMLKELLGLAATAEMAIVVGELAKLRQWSAPGAAPPGVDVDELIGGMRTLFNLPALSTADEVMGEVDKVIARLIQDQAGQPAGSGTGAAATAALAKERKAEMELLKILAGKLNVRENDDAVAAAVDSLNGMQADMKKLLGTDGDAPKTLLEEVEKSVSARKMLTALLKALGVEKPDDAVNKVAELMTQAKELSTVMPELKNLRTKVAKQDEETATAEVDAVIAAKGWDESLRDALLLERKESVEKFREKFPLPKQGDAALLSSVVLSRQGQGAGGPQPPKAQLPNMINLAQYPGDNVTMCAMNYIKSTVPEADKWSHDDLFVKACELKKQPNVIYEAQQ